MSDSLAFGPSVAWIDAADVAECCAVDLDENGVGPPLLNDAATAASQLLFEISGRFFVGEQETTVRPCQTACGCGWQVLSRGHIVYSGDSWDCGGWPCGCRSLSRVKLSGYPVREVTEVLIDGVAVDPVTYRLDKHRYLVRVRDPDDPNTVLRWPGCQALDLPDTEDGTFSVSYSFGQDPPQIGIDAAAQLACELYKECNGEACSLPKGTTRVTRQGVQIDKVAFASWAFDGGWKTGLALVDAFLAAYNPAALKRRPIFWAPSSTHRYAPPVGS